MSDTDVERVFFLDVGQGSANLIEVGPGRFIVIDCGPAQSSRDSRRRPLEEAVLERAGRGTEPILELLVFSHSHDDHWRGLEMVVKSCRARAKLGLPSLFPFKQIKRILVVDDRDTEKILDEDGDQAFARFLLELFDVLETTGNEFQFQTIRLDHGVPFSELGLDGIESRLILLHPTIEAAKKARESHKLNFGSGIVLFKSAANHDHFIFAGDAPIAAWEDIYARLNAAGEKLPLKVCVLAVPHHGGVAWPPKKNKERDDAYQERVMSELSRLFKDFMDISNAFISVGSHNNYEHPLESVIRALKVKPSNVYCSQLTRRCLPKDSQKSLHELRPHTFHGMSRLDLDDETQVGLAVIPGCSALANVESQLQVPMNVGCASTLVAVMNPGCTTKIYRADQHGGVVKQLKELGASPKCLCD